MNRMLVAPARTSDQPVPAQRQRTQRPDGNKPQPGFASNRSALRWLETQRAVAASGERYEREADGASKLAHKPIVSRIDFAPSSPAPPAGYEALRRRGHALDTKTLASMEQHFGRDFSAVRVHTDSVAAQSARAIHARAYTVGNDIAFGAGQYSPHQPNGRALLAHELTHVAQQNGNPVAIQRAPDSEADLAAPRKELNDAIASLQHTIDTEDEEDVPVAQAKKPASSYDHLCGGRKCLTDEEINRPLKEANDRIDAEIARDRARSKIPYGQRFGTAVYQMAQAQLKKLQSESPGIRVPEISVQAPNEIWSYGMAHDLFFESEKKAVYEDAEELAKKTFKERYDLSMLSVGNRWNPGDRPTPAEEVWSYGYSNGLFLPTEKKAVFERRNGHIGRLKIEAEEKRENERRQNEMDRERRFIEGAEAAKAQGANLFIAPFAGGGLGLVGTAYDGAQMGMMVGGAYNACVRGSAGECVENLAPVVVGGLVHRSLRSEPVAAEPVGPRPTPIEGGNQQTPRTATLQSVAPDGTLSPPRGHRPTGTETPAGARPGQAANDNISVESNAQQLAKTGTDGKGEMSMSGPVKKGTPRKTLYNPRNKVRFDDPYERGRTSPSRQAGKDSSSILDTLDDLERVNENQETVTTKRKTNRPMSERQIHSEAGDAIEPVIISEWARAQPPSAKVYASAEIPESISRLYPKGPQGKGGPDAIAIDAGAQPPRIVIFDSTPSSTPAHTTKTYGYAEILKDNLPAQYRGYEIYSQEGWYTGGTRFSKLKKH